MDNATQQIIGRALYNASVDFTDSRTPEWEYISNKEEWIWRAEKVVLVFVRKVSNDFLSGSDSGSAK